MPTARPFRHEAETRQLAFDVEVDSHLGRSITTDSKRLQQVLKNLLSNAFKFTEHGGVRLGVSAAVGGWSAEHPILNQSPAVVAFEVSDTGIGIPLEKQKIIFEAFQQADASTSRKYGGTGLGLAISRELANLLGGEIHLRSVPGRGSNFTLYLPVRYVGPTTAGRLPTPTPTQSSAAAVLAHAAVPERPIEPIPDDRLELMPGDTILLIVEDDPHYARVVMDLARDKGFKVLVATRGADALDLAKQFQPTAVSLDVFLPDMLGWTVLSQLKQNPLTRHIPVQIITLDEDRQHALGARRVRIRHQADHQRRGGGGDGAHQGLCEAATKTVARGRRQCSRAAEHQRTAGPRRHRDCHRPHRRRRARAAAAEPCDCVVLDLRLPDMSGFDVLEQLRGDAGPRRHAGRRFHRPGVVGRRGCATAHHGAQHRRQGRGIAGATARRDGLVPASGRRPICRPRSSACSSG